MIFLLITVSASLFTLVIKLELCTDIERTVTCHKSGNEKVKCTQSVNWATMSTKLLALFLVASSIPCIEVADIVNLLKTDYKYLSKHFYKPL